MNPLRIPDAILESFRGLNGAYKRNPQATATGGGTAFTCKLV